MKHVDLDAFWMLSRAMIALFRALDIKVFRTVSFCFVQAPFYCIFLFFRGGVGKKSTPSIIFHQSFLYGYSKWSSFRERVPSILVLHSTSVLPLTSYFPQLCRWRDDGLPPVFAPPPPPQTPPGHSPVARVRAMLSSASSVHRLKGLEDAEGAGLSRDSESTAFRAKRDAALLLGYLDMLCEPYGPPQVRGYSYPTRVYHTTPRCFVRLRVLTVDHFSLQNVGYLYTWVGGVILFFCQKRFSCTVVCCSASQRGRRVWYMPCCYQR